jgi:hypothetical protein
MLYMLLIYTDEAEWASYNASAQAAVMRGHERLEAELREQGKYKSCAALEPTSSATTVRVRDGQMLVTDGPFTETKEQFGGYYLIDAKNLDEAMAIAARIPGASNGSVEVRPVAALNA